MFFSGLFQRKSDAPVTTPAELADAIGLSYDTYTGKQISSQRAMRLTAVFSCVRVQAESVGMLPCNLYHLNGSLKQRATGERLHKLISTHPNGYMTPQEFWELVVTCLCLRGNFYAYKVKAFGEVAELLPVDPGCVVTGLSIGYVLKDWEYDRTKEAFLLKEIDLWEVSLVTFPSNDEARISDVKNALARGEIPEQKKIERVLRDVGLSRTQAKAFMAGGYGALSLRDAEDVGSALNALKNLNF
ncbi:TPA: phage portal protein [Escherichia coli]